MRQPLISSGSDSATDEGRKRNNDPFYTCKAELSSHLRSVMQQQHHWERCLSDAGPTGSKQLFAADKELKRQLREVQPGINMLLQVLRTIESQRQNFKHIDDAELERRKQFVSSTRATVRKVQRQADEANVDAMMAQNNRKNLFARGEETESETKRSTSKGGMTEAYITDARVSHTDMVEEQDQCVDDMLEGLDNLASAAEDIGDEIEDSKKDINKMTKNVSKARQAFLKVNDTLSKFLKVKDNCQVWVLVSLSVIAVVLLLMVILSFVI